MLEALCMRWWWYSVRIKFVRGPGRRACGDVIVEHVYLAVRHCFVLSSRSYTSCSSVGEISLLRDGVLESIKVSMD